MIHTFKMNEEFYLIKFVTLFSIISLKKMEVVDIDKDSNLVKLAALKVPIGSFSSEFVPIDADFEDGKVYYDRSLIGRQTFTILAPTKELLIEGFTNLSDKIFTQLHKQAKVNKDLLVTSIKQI